VGEGTDGSGGELGQVKVLGLNFLARGERTLAVVHVRGNVSNTLANSIVQSGLELATLEYTRKGNAHTPTTSHVFCRMGHHSLAEAKTMEETGEKRGTMAPALAERRGKHWRQDEEQGTRRKGSMTASRIEGT
jgi:hypothetical protein